MVGLSIDQELQDTRLNGGGSNWEDGKKGQEEKDNGKGGKGRKGKEGDKGDKGGNGKKEGG